MSGTDQLAAWSEQADRAAREGRWTDAAGLLENVHSVDPGYPDLTRRLTVAVARRQEQAEARRQQLSELYVRAGQAEAGGRVDEAVAALAQLVTLDPANTDAARRLQLLQQGGAGFDAVGWAAPTAAYGMTPPGPPGAYGHSFPPGPPPDAATPAGSAAAPGPPAPARRRSRAWIIAAVAGALVLALVVGTVLLRDRIASAFGGAPSSTPTISPPSTEPSTAAPTPTAGLTTPELRAHIPAAISPTCTEYAPPVAGGLEADLTGALRCELDDATAPATVWYLAYADTAAMEAASRPFADATFTAGDCRAKDERFVYTDTEPGEKESGGVLLCYESEAGETSFVWTHDDLRVLSLAADPDLGFSDMRSWWEGAGPVR